MKLASRVVNSQNVNIKKAAHQRAERKYHLIKLYNVCASIVKSKRFLVLALLVVFAVSFATGDADARRRSRSSGGSLPVLAVTSIADSQIRLVQQKLEQLGYDPGPIDGITGPKTYEAVMCYQKDYGLVVDGIAGEETLRSLGM